MKGYFKADESSDLVKLSDFYGENLLKGTTDEWQDYQGKNKLFYQRAYDFKVDPEKTYTFSLEFKKTSNDNFPIQLDIGMGNQPFKYEYDTGITVYNVQNLDRKVSVTFRYKDTHRFNPDYLYFAFRLRNDLKDTNFRVRKMILSEGEVATPWTPAWSDLTTTEEKLEHLYKLYHRRY